MLSPYVPALGQSGVASSTTGFTFAPRSYVPMASGARARGNRAATSLIEGTRASVSQSGHLIFPGAFAGRACIRV
jgi:hypothetical protein